MRCTALIVISAALLALPISGARPRTTRIEGPEAFAEGRLRDVAIDDRGVLTLAPPTRLLLDTESPAVWSVAVAPDGAVFAGTGNDGKVYRIGQNGASLFFDAEELLVTALAVGPDGRLYVGTSPDGKVYAVGSHSRSRTVADPGTKYIWALAFDTEDRLLVATGAPGKVIRVSPNGDSDVLFSSDDTHIQALAVDGHGNVLAGSSPSGIVYRVDGEGHAFALLDSPYEEVKSIATRPDGSLYALLTNGKPQQTAPAPPPPPSSAATDATATKAEVTVTESFSLPAGATQAPLRGTNVSPDTVPADATAGALVRIRVDGSTETLWASKDDAPYAMASTPGGCLVASGSKARLHRVGDDGRYSVFSPIAAEQILSLAPARNGTFIAGAANPGAVFAIDAGHASRGSYESPVRDGGSHSTWGRVDLLADTPPGTRVLVSTRSGNTARPDNTWSEWSGQLTAAQGFRSPSPSGRFLQLRLDLESTSDASPRVHSLGLTYLPTNRRPRIAEIEVHPPGEVLQKPPVSSENLEILGLSPQLPTSTPGQPPEGPEAPSATSYARKAYVHGIRTFSWRAEDPDSDSLVYIVSCRRIGETSSLVLRSVLTESVLAWDTRSLPDGRYILSVEVSDAPGNPATLALTGRRESLPFDVDNTAPRISAVLSPNRPSRIRVDARDEASAIQRLEYSLDGSTWNEVYPVDGLADSPSEAFDFIPRVEEGAKSRALAVRVFDRLGNTAFAHIAIP